jgi:protein involved in polysaccharide export with SLBB domain
LRGAILFALLLATSSLFAQTRSSDSREYKKEYVIQKGDALIFEKFAGQIACLWFPGRIRDDGGKFTLPLVGDIPAAGRTPAQLTADIETRIAEYFTRTDVSLRVRDKSGVDHR